jgi:membrane protein
MPPRLERLLHFCRYLVRRFIADNCPESAAALTYTTLFAVVPVMTVTYAMLAAIPAFADVGGQIEDFIFQNFVPATGEALRNYLHDFSQQARQLTGIGVAVLMITAFFMLLKIEKAFNGIWRVRQPRKGVSSFLLYWAVLSLGPLLLGAGFAVSTYIASMNVLAAQNVVGDAGRWVLGWVPLLLSMAAFTLTYVAVPNTRVPLRHALVGGVLVALVFEGAKAGFGVYLTLFPGYQLIYGAFATFPLFLLWIFISWLIILFGAELVANLGNSSAWRRVRYPRLINLLGLLRVFQHAQRQGHVVDPGWAQADGWQMDEDLWRDLTGWLEAEHFISRTQTGGFVLIRDLDKMNMAEFLAQLPEALPAVEQLPKRLEGDHPWYPAFVEAVAQLEHQRQEIMGGSLKCWLDDFGAEQGVRPAGQETSSHD